MTIFQAVPVALSVQPATIDWAGMKKLDDIFSRMFHSGPSYEVSESDLSSFMDLHKKLVNTVGDHSSFFQRKAYK